MLADARRTHKPGYRWMCNHAQESPLFIAALKGSTACVKAILQSPSHGLLDYNIWLNRNLALTTTSADGRNDQNSKHLKAVHEDARRRQHGWSPVHAACVAGDAVSLALLLKQARINAKGLTQLKNTSLTIIF